MSCSKSNQFLLVLNKEALNSSNNFFPLELCWPLVLNLWIKNYDSPRQKGSIFVIWWTLPMYLALKSASLPISKCPNILTWAWNFLKLDFPTGIPFHITQNDVTCHSLNVNKKLTNTHKGSWSTNLDYGIIRTWNITREFVKIGSLVYITHVQWSIPIMIVHVTVQCYAML